MARYRKVPQSTAKYRKKNGNGVFQVPQSTAKMGAIYFGASRLAPHNRQAVLVWGGAVPDKTNNEAHS